MKKPVPLNIAYRIIGPGPIVLVSSALNGKAGITPIAWHMPVNDDPPRIALEIWDKHYIFKAIMKTGDFVVNIPSDDMAVIVRKLGSVSGHKEDKFALCGLSEEPSKKISSPRIKGALAVLECKLCKDAHMLKKYNIVLGDVVYAEAEKSVFTDRWDFKKGKRIMHHLGGKIFSVPERKVI